MKALRGTFIHVLVLASLLLGGCAGPARAVARRVLVSTAARLS